MSNQVGLMRFYGGWAQYQEWLIESVTLLNKEQLALTIAPNQRPAWLIMAHIIGTRVGSFHEWLGEGDAELAKFDPWDADGAPPRSAAELVEGLQATWEMIRECLERWTPDDLDVVISKRGDSGPRGWVVWHLLEHDIHHGGEYFMTVGTHGLPTPDM